MKHIAVLGAGNLGTALAQILAKGGHRVWLWDYNLNTVEAIAKGRENKKFLPGVRLSARIKPEISMKVASEKAELIVIAVSSPFVRTTASHLAHCLREDKKIIVQVAKGVEEKTFATMHEVVQSELPSSFQKNVVTLSGPSLADEFVRGIPTAVVAASEDKKAAEAVSKVFTSATFKVVVSRDVRGVGLCGALKNIYSIALGMCDGMRLLMNAKAFMITLALQEMEDIISAFRGRRETVYGLAGIGDLIVSGLGEGRNRALGERICKEGSCRFVFRGKNSQTVEGVAAARIFAKACQSKKLKAPLLTLVYRVLYRGVDPCKAVEKFFREFRFHEIYSSA